MDSPTVGGQVVMLNMGTHSGLSGTPSTLTLIALNIMNHFLLIQAIPLKWNDGKKGNSVLHVHVYMFIPTKIKDSKLIRTNEFYFYL